MSEAKAALITEETPWSRLDRAFRTVLTVSKDRLLKEEAKVKRHREKKRAKRSV